MGQRVLRKAREEEGERKSQETFLYPLESSETSEIS